MTISIHLILLVAIISASSIVAFLAGAYVYWQASRLAMRDLIDALPIPERREEEEALRETVGEPDYDYFEREEEKPS